VSITQVHLKMQLVSKDITDDGASFGMAFEFSPGDSGNDLSPFPLLVDRFFNLVGEGQVNPLCQYISPSIDRGVNHSSWAVYDISGHLNGTPAGGPVAAGSFTLGPAVSAKACPEGVAICVGWRAAYGSDVEFGPVVPPETGPSRPRARDRNRLYFGPLDGETLELDPSTQRTRLAQSVLSDVLIACNAMGESPPPGWYPRVWSRKNAAVKPPVEWFTDDRPDYQRRRSDPSTIRTTLPVIFP
jgi:hypothetical protein